MDFARHSLLVAVVISLIISPCALSWSVPSKNIILRRNDGTPTHTRHSDASKWATPFVVAATLSLTSINPAFAASSSVFTNDYADPFHPLCERHIKVSRDGTTFHYSGTAVGPKNDPVNRGCTPEEIEKYGLRKGAFDGVILNGGKRISVGDGIHEGVWEPANSASTKLGYGDIDGIRWNDGNKWTVLPKEKKSLGASLGEGIVWAYLGGSTLAGFVGVFLARNQKAK